MTVRKIIRARDVMNQRFLIMQGLKTVREALEAMHGESAIPIIVEKRTDNDEFGMVLLVDIARKVLAKDRAPERVNIYEVMTKPLVTVHPEMDVRYCARLMERLQLTVVPVLDGAEIVGVVDYEGLVLHGLLGLYGETAP